MYAQLCKRLSEEAPNFDPEDGPCTFNRLLLTKCQDEFEKRRRASELWERTNGQSLTPEEEEQRSAARRKMVGNLRFIGELGKLEIINKSILHNCIQQLLERKRQRTIADLAEDLECLCQIMRTCGKVLDKPKAKYLMDQYFERMAQLSMNIELPSRIRFMLQDSLDLRAANWVPRKVAQVDGPRTIQQVREEAARDLGIYIPPPNSQGPPRPSGPISPLSVMPSFFPQGCGSRTGMEDVFGLPPIGAVTLGTGPGVISSQPDKFSYETNGYSNNSTNRDPGFRQRQQTSSNFTSNSFYQNKHFSIQNRQNTQNSQQANYSSAASKDLPPRFMKMFSQGRGPSNSSGGDELSLRPTTTMMLKPKTPGVLPGSAQGYSQSQDLFVTSQPQPPNQKPAPTLLHKEPPILIKPSATEKAKSNKKDKGLTKEEHLRRVNDLLESLYNGQDVPEVAESFKSLKIPDRFTGNVASSIITSLLRKDESTIELGAQLMKHLRADNIINLDTFLEAYNQILDQLEEATSDVPRIKSNLALILGVLIASGVMSLAEAMEPLHGGHHYPLFLLVLQMLHKSEGKAKLISLYNESKVNLMNILSEADRSKEKLADLLEDRELSFLYPLLRIQSDLWRALVADPAPQSFYKYIKDNLDVEHHTAPSFINALVAVLVKYITQDTSMAPGMDTSVIPDKVVTEQEKELLLRYKPVLQAFLHDHTKLQVVAIYSLQVFTYTNNFPKGMLLRWFMTLYELEIIEEEAFLAWKEDLNQDYPGKGKALFQVNQWLTWLQEAEEDEEEDEEEG